MAFGVARSGFRFAGTVGCCGDDVEAALGWCDLAVAVVYQEVEGGGEKLEG